MAAPVVQRGVRLRDFLRPLFDHRYEAVGRLHVLLGHLLTALPIFLHPIIESFFFLNDLEAYELLVLPLDEWVACHEHALVEVLRVALYHMDIFHQISSAAIFMVPNFVLWVAIHGVFPIRAPFGVVRDQS